MQVVEKRPPYRIVVEDGVSEADDRAVQVGHDRAMVLPRLREPVRPGIQPLGHDVTVEERIQIRAAVVPSPAICMKRGDGLHVGAPSQAVPHVVSVRHSEDLLIDPGVGTVP
jgi:hypothetical protein